MKNILLTFVLSLQIAIPGYSQQTPSIDVHTAIDELNFFLDYEVAPHSNLNSAEFLSLIDNKLNEIEQQGISKIQIYDELTKLSSAKGNDEQVYTILRNIDPTKLEREQFLEIFSSALKSSKMGGSHWSPLAADEEGGWAFDVAMAGAGLLTLALFAVMWCDEHKNECKSL